MFRLTIAITTRNRAAFIGETLDSILPQLTAEVELLVLDGASTDRTPDVVREYQRRCASLRYVRLETNDGLDQDFNRSVEQAAGEYVWLMTDDDLLKPEAVQNVLRAIEQNHCLIIVNAEVRNTDFSQVIESRRLRLPADRVFLPAERNALFAETGGYLSFIGGVVIRRTVWLARDRERYFGTLFIHFGVIFQAPLPGTALAIAEPLIVIRYGNAMWRPRDFEIWMFKWPELIWSFDDVSAEARGAVARPEPWRRIRTLLLFRARGAYSVHEYRRWIKPRLPRAGGRAAAWLIARLPGIIANPAAVLYCSVIRGDLALPLFDLKRSRYYFRNWRRRAPAKV